MTSAMKGGKSLGFWRLLRASPNTGTLTKSQWGNRSSAGTGRSKRPTNTVGSKSAECVLPLPINLFAVSRQAISGGSAKFGHQIRSRDNERDLSAEHFDQDALSILA